MKIDVYEVIICSTICECKTLEISCLIMQKNVVESILSHPQNGILESCLRKTERDISVNLNMKCFPGYFVVMH